MEEKKKKAYPRGYSRKDLENLIDQYGSEDDELTIEQVEIFSAKASLGLAELQRRTAKWSLALSIVAAVLVVLSVGWSIYIGVLQKQSSKENLELNKKLMLLSIEPQIGVYLVDQDDKGLKIGIENKGTISIINYSADAYIVSVNKEDYKLGKENTEYSVVTETDSNGHFWAVKLLKPSEVIEKLTGFLPMSKQEKKWLDILYLDISFQREIDKQEFKQMHVFFIDQNTIYTLNQVKDNKEFQPIIQDLGKIVVDSGWTPWISNKKVYSQ